jgi:hypothetical protein
VALRPVVVGEVEDEGEDEDDEGEVDEGEVDEGEVDEGEVDAPAVDPSVPEEDEPVVDLVAEWAVGSAATMAPSPTAENTDAAPMAAVRRRTRVRARSRTLEASLADGVRK